MASRITGSGMTVMLRDWTNAVRNASVTTGPSAESRADVLKSATSSLGDIGNKLKDLFGGG